jgi:hypothetical protein
MGSPFGLHRKVMLMARLSDLPEEEAIALIPGNAGFKLTG